MKTPKEITVNYLESVKWEIDEQGKRLYYEESDRINVPVVLYKIQTL